MLDLLVASNPRRHATWAEFSTSATMHVGLFFLVVLATHTTVEAVRPIVADTTLVFLPRLAAPAVDRPAPVHAGGGGGGDGGALIISANPPPRGFQVINAIASIPTEIPPVDLSMKSLDPRDFTGRGVEGGVGWGIEGGTGPADQPPGEIKEMLYRAETVDARFTPAVLVVRPVFTYPELQLAAGVPGKVVLQFVIDTVGRIEPTTIEVLERTNEAFANSAKRGVLDARFEPATFGGHRVRQLSKWPVKFELATR